MPNQSDHADSCSEAYQKLRYLLHVNEYDQQKVSKAIGASEATVSINKNNPRYRPNMKVRREIDEAYENASVIWSKELETIGQGVERTFQNAFSLDDEGATEVENGKEGDAIWVQVAGLARMAASDWMQVMKDPTKAVLTRLVFAHV
jgi:hypothetical protein